MAGFKLGQKVTIHKTHVTSFYAPLNGIIVSVESILSKNDLSASFGLEDYIRRSTKAERYAVAYVQKGFMDKISTVRNLLPEEIQPGWHGMKSNGDREEFKKFGAKVPGFN